MINNFIVYLDGDEVVAGKCEVGNAEFIIII